MMEIIEKRNSVSQSTNSTNISCGRKIKKMEPSGGDERNAENNGQRMFSPGTHESFTNQPFVEEVSDDGADSSKEESDGDVVIISEEEEEKEEEEEESDPNVVREEDEEEESNLDVAIIREGEESDPDVIIREGKEEEESDHGIVIIREEEEESDLDIVIIRKNEEEEEKSEFLKFIVKSIKIVNDHNKVTPPEKKEHVFIKETLPLIFGFEDQEPLPPEKEEWGKEIDNLFIEMNMCIKELHIGFTNPSVSPMQSGKLSDCQMGNHHLVLDEQIGLICSVCPYVHSESKYIFRPFAQRTRGRYKRKYFEESPSLLDVDGFRVSDLYGEGNVDNVFHQREGFEFMWNNIAGDITLERLREPLSKSKGGCIISHPPGTGKTQLTICRLVIIFPSNLLLKWEAEFQKWAVDIPFHNLNNKDFSLKEDEGIVGVFNCLSRVVKKNPHLIRMVKLQSWAKSQSVLGISYDLFTILTGEDGEGYAKETREILRKFPGLLGVVWKALRKVEIEKRILLSRTPFKNNIKDLYNTLCIVNPKFAADFKQKWASLSSSIDKNARALEELRDIISPLVHEFTLCGI
ncbi:hypothetical protein R3W88_000946 [Solanum pinnatisectum]|uniref:SNF2 N-terminal domain-containing protein n=1 Tax=Solanum pinnatisectum TaxID=50273 RepID=A0AAV9MJJ6_9SOLN|nr:hypothetical protein R3W88_000946 [Solanum pinnatisectum]